MSIQVFLADDHGVVRDGLRVLLETHNGITVMGEAADGRKTVSLVRKLNPDVVVMDIAMPLLSGIEATRQIRETCFSTQVVILSAHATKEYVFRALESGALGYVLKESTGQELASAVKTASMGKRYLSQRIVETVIDDYIDHRKVSKTSPVDRLSSREWEVLQLVVEGKSSAQISDIICLSSKTVETYRSRLMRKLGVKDIPTLVKFAIQHGLTSLE